MTARASAVTPHSYTPPAQPFRLVSTDGRRGGFCTEDKPRCVHGHALKTRDPETLRNLIESTVATCRHQARGDAPQCGARLYLHVVQVGGSTQVRDAGERVLFVMEVTGEHIKVLRKTPMTFLEVLNFLGCALPNVDFDLIGATQDEEDAA